VLPQGARTIDTARFASHCDVGGRNATRESYEKKPNAAYI